MIKENPELPTKPNFIKTTDISMESVGELTRFLKLRYCLDFTSYKLPFLRRRLVGRMNRMGISSFPQYMGLIQADPEERSKLISNLTINVSEFMRNPEVFDKIRKIIFPRIIADRDQCDKPIRIWTAGCSTGEEAYSLAILMAESEKLRNLPLTIIATDIDQDALKSAQIGIYNESALTNISEELKERYFSRITEGKYQIKTELTDSIRFIRHNIVYDKSFGQFDIIVCRNVSIYFDKGLQYKMYNRFYQSLYNYGFYVSGKTEMLPLNLYKFFLPIDRESRIYQKIPNSNYTEGNPICQG
ncbi:protein-glutamate O-methyltransferase CheR [bacterium]|nr:protein-glutamate O-methyltransferase CheR [bacterium]